MLFLIINKYHENTKTNSVLVLLALLYEFSSPSLAEVFFSPIEDINLKITSQIYGSFCFKETIQEKEAALFLEWLVTVGFLNIKQKEKGFCWGSFLAADWCSSEYSLQQDDDCKVEPK